MHNDYTWKSRMTGRGCSFDIVSVLAHSVEHSDIARAWRKAASALMTAAYHVLFESFHGTCT